MEIWQIAVYGVACFIVGFILGKLKLTKTVYDGTLEVSQKNARMIHKLQIDTDPEDLSTKNVILFRVKKVKDNEPSEVESQDKHSL